MMENFDGEAHCTVVGQSESGKLKRGYCAWNLVGLTSPSQVWCDGRIFSHASIGLESLGDKQSFDWQSLT